jgi:hypothetical protein
MKLNNISNSVKKVIMKIKEMARSVLHFALNIFSLSLSYFHKHFVTSVRWLQNYADFQYKTDKNKPTRNERNNNKSGLAEMRLS